MTRWLQAALSAIPPGDKTDETDETLSGVSGGSASCNRREVSSVMSVLSDGGISPDLAAPPSASSPSRPDADPFRHGGSATGSPITWTGRVVSLDAWRKLSAWDRHGPDGRHWDGKSQQWERPGGGAA